MFLFLLAACDFLYHDCTLLYAPNGFTLDATVAAEGTWDWTVSAGDSLGSCTVTLPDATDGACDGSGSLTVEPDGATWSLLSRFTPPGDAEAVEIVVGLDGAEVWDETITPDWTTSEPNGEGCGTRISAAYDVDLTDVD